MNEDLITLMGTFIKEKGLVRFQTDSYNDFIARRVPKILNQIGVIKPEVPELGEFKIKLGKFKIGEPSVKEADGSIRNILPLEARIRNLTYPAPMFVEMTPVLNNIESDTITVNFGDMPVMVKSKICSLSQMSRQELIEVGEDPDDPGGYFIINGTERILVLIEEIAPNRVITARVSTGNVAEIARIHSEKDGYIQRHIVERKHDGSFVVSFANVNKLSLVTLLKALGLESDKEIVTALSDDPDVQEEFYVNLYESGISTKEEAMNEIGNHIKIPQTEYRSERTTKLVDRYLLPHLGQEPTNRMEKALFLVKAASKVIRLHLNKIEEDDLDHYSNKRLRLAGDLLEILLRSILLGKWGLITRITYNYQKLTKRGRLPPLQAIVESNVLTNQLVSALAIGSWVGGRTGVSQRLERGSYIKTISHMRNVLSPLTSTQEHFEARELHPTHWCKLCLDKDTNILLCKQHSTKTLADLEDSWQTTNVLTFDSNKKKFEESSLKDYFKINPTSYGKKVFKIISESGRNIIATEDHPFLTMSGWEEVRSLNMGDMIAVCPTLDLIKENSKTNEMILTEKTIKKLFPKRYKHYIKKLKSVGLLPLSLDNKKLDSIARLIGHLFSDGSVGKVLDFNCGSIKDVESVISDIESLGISANNYREVNTKIELNGKIVRYKTYKTVKGCELRALTIALGAPIGDKRNRSFKIPNWLFKAPKNVKREFLAAYIGGDGPKPTYEIRKHRKNSSKIMLPELIFHKREDLVDSGINFANNLRRLLKEFDIKIKSIKVKDGYTRKDGTKTKKIVINFSNERTNIANLTQKLGYRYCSEKEKMSNLIGEYLRIRHRIINDRISIKQKIIDCYTKGLGVSEISKETGKSEKFVRTILERRTKFKNSYPRMIPVHKWINENVDLDSSIVWESILSIEEVSCTDVRDVTTSSNSHSFIANGFIVHNCTSETPEGATIGLRKYLALMAEVTKGAEEKDVKSVQSLIQKMVK